MKDSGTIVLPERVGPSSAHAQVITSASTSLMDYLRATTGHFDSEAVEKYKTARLCALKHPYVPKAFYFVRMMAYLYIFLGFVHIGLDMYLAETPSLTLVGAFIGGLVLFIGAIFRIIPTGLPFNHPQAQWEERPYWSYIESHPVPQEVREVAERLQQRFPEGEMTVQYLYEDPFLKFKVPTDKAGKNFETAIVAFWDENGFIH